MRAAFNRAMILIGVLSSIGTAFAAEPDADCARFKADVSVQLRTDEKTPYWAGTGILSLGDEQIVGDVVAVPDPKSLQFYPDGSYTGRETATFSSSVGSFEVEDYFRVEPTDTPGKQMFHAEGNILTGTGIFDSTFGRLRIRGPIYLDAQGGATAELKANGSVCTLKK